MYTYVMYMDIHSTVTQVF